MLTEIRALTPQPIKDFLRRIIYVYRWDPWQRSSWSQEGEDLILARIFGDKLDGFYVDVGAHHPKRFSNTYYFYRRGWRGINIDAMPGSMNLFDRLRPLDINIELGIGSQPGKLNFYMFNEPALNGFAKELANSRDQAETPYKIVGTRSIDVRPLSQVLKEHLPSERTIDFMSVDVEGLDLDVLRSNDWTLYRPSYLLAEILDSSLSDIENHLVTQFMAEVGYRVYAKCVHTVIFKNMDA
jgi:FkbM family methyltransferase